MTFKTTDLYLAAYLQAKGFSLRALRGKKPKSVFLFDEDSSIKKEVESFLSNKSTVSAFDYALAIKNMKGLVQVNRP